MLFAFTRGAAEDAHLLSLDLPQGMYGGGYHRWKVPAYKQFALPKQKLVLLKADSHQASSFRIVKDNLGGRKIDFMFIDADHTYEGLKQDFEVYSPLVSQSGIVAFHDIVPHPTDSSYGVAEFWREIKTQYEHDEIVESWTQTGAGIGILYF